MKNMFLINFNEVLEILIDNKDRVEIIDEVLKLKYYYLPSDCDDLEIVRKENE